MVSGNRKKRLKDILKRRLSLSTIYFLTSSETKHLECFVNNNFQKDETCLQEFFMYAFGHKGKNIGEFEDVKHVTCLPRNRLLITDFINNRLQICSVSNKSVNVLIAKEMCLPWAAAITKSNCIAVTMCQDKCVNILNSNGNVISTFGQDRLVHPTGIAIDKTGNIIVCDDILNKVMMFSSDGKFLRFLGNKEDDTECFKKPLYVCVSITGDIIVSDTGHHKIKIFDLNGQFVRSFGTFGKGDMQFKCPYGICTNAYGDIFVADHYNSRISMFTQEGVFVRHIVTSKHGLVHPQGLTISHDMYMYVSHGNLKASEIIILKLTNYADSEDVEMISHL